MKHRKISNLVSSLLVSGLFLATYFPVWGQAPDELSLYARQFGSSLYKPLRKDKEKTRSAPLPRSDDNDAVRVETSLIINDILVFDKMGKPVTGLTQADFTLLEDKSTQNIAVFSHNDSVIPRSIILVIDYSLSQLPYIITSVEAAKVLVDKLNPNDRMAIVTDDIKLVVEPTSDRTLLKAGLESLKTRALSGQVGDSKQYSALMAVLNELLDKGGTRPIVIFQTDGDELGSLVSGRLFSGIGDRKMGFSYDDVLKAAESEGATIYTVFSGLSFIGLSRSEKYARAQRAIDDSNRAAAILQGKTLPERSKIDRKYQGLVADYRLHDETAVARIADLTRGIASTLESPDQAAPIYDRILSDINSRYVLGYYPTNEARDGQRRQIKIEVRGHPEYTIWGRTSYIAPAEHQD